MLADVAKHQLGTIAARPAMATLLTPPRLAPLQPFWERLCGTSTWVCGAQYTMNSTLAHGPAQLSGDDASLEEHLAAYVQIIVHAARWWYFFMGKVFCVLGLWMMTL